MKKKTALIALVLSGLVLTSCSTENTENDPVEETTEQTTAIASEEKEVKTGEVKTITINSENVADNLIGQSGERTIYAYLPPAYSEDGKALPVVYFLHGYDDSSQSFADRTKLELDKAFGEKENQFIVVVLDGNIKTGGSFYVNSPVSGKWEDFVVNDVVNYIDTNFNTIADCNSRSIMGYSMGGYGAINIALKHPDVFSSVLTFAPGIYADGDINSLWKSWSGWQSVKRSYAQAFSPSDDPEVSYGNIPEFNGTDEDNAIIEQWDNGYGCWEKKIDEYITNGIYLKGMQLNYSENDEFSWIPNGCIFFKEVLDQRGIKNEQNVFGGGHVVPLDAYDIYIIPFMDKYLSFE